MPHNIQNLKTEKGIEFIISVNLTQQTLDHIKFLWFASELSKMILMLTWEEKKKKKREN